MTGMVSCRAKQRNMALPVSQVVAQEYCGTYIAGRTFMLSSCKAVVIGRTPAQLDFLAKTADRCGFAFVEGAGRAGTQSLHAALQFILIDYRVGDDHVEAVVNAIRAGANAVRFAPVIVIANDCPFDKVLFYVRHGVDDVITLPEKREVLTQRFSQQLNTEQMYLKTADYFGPDRRRLDLDTTIDTRRQGMAGHERFFFRRVPGRGIEILRHEIFTAKVEPQALRKVG
jgi:response regulator RpfG family c-di-GMP phosphodiesterase